LRIKIGMGYNNDYINIPTKLYVNTKMIGGEGRGREGGGGRGKRGEGEGEREKEGLKLYPLTNSKNAA
jgi:hypothetical protein